MKTFILSFIVLVLVGYHSALHAQIWEPTSGPRANGYIEEFHVGFNNAVYAVAGSLYRTTDRGDTWSMVLNNGLPIPASYMTIDSTGDMYVGTYLHNDHKLIFSSDHGVTWHLKNTLQASGGRPTISLGNGELVRAEQNVMKSTDSGASWKEVAKGMLLTRDIQGRLFAATPTNEGVLMSTDKGETWALTPTPIGRVTSATAIGEDLYVTINYHDVYKGKAGSSLWKYLVWPSQLYGFTVSAGRGQSIYGYARGAVIYRSDDEGDTWTELYSGIPLGVLPDQLTSDKQGNLFFVDERTVYRERLGSSVRASHSTLSEIWRNGSIVHIKPENSEEYRVELYDILGRRIHESEIAGGETQSIDLLLNVKSVFVCISKGGEVVASKLLP